MDRTAATRTAYAAPPPEPGVTETHVHPHPRPIRPLGRVEDRSQDQEPGAVTPGQGTEPHLPENGDVYPRPLTDRERAVLTALLAVEFDQVDQLRRQAAKARVFGGCPCGCPSIDFFEGRNSGMSVVVDAAVNDSETYDGLFLFTVVLPGTGEVLGGIEWVGQGDSNPGEFPRPEDLTITVAGP